MKSIRLILLFLFSALYGFNQTVCNTAGQNPGTAFPVCGTATFIQSSVNLCGGKQVPNPKCKTTPLSDINPYWYKFTCFQSGTLGFTITPNSNVSDYDWQVFDVTGHNPNDVYTDVTTVVCGNWSEYFGTTGTTATAANLMECEGKVPQYSKMPDLIQGHNYLLLVSHFSNTQAGYKLEFKGGTAIITDSTQPQMKELSVGCTGKQFYLKLNKKMKCSSIAADGSDWEFFNGNIPIASVVGVGCAAGFDTDSLIITTQNQVPAGTFALRSKKGSDGNTMLDYCDAPLPEGQTLVVNVLPASATLIDSLRPVGCKPSELELVMKDFIDCSSIAADGSDFSISGPSPLTISGAAQAGCANGAVKVIKLQLATPLQTAGLYTVSIKQGSDGNTLINQCAKATPVGNSATVFGYDTVSAKIDLALNSSCMADTATFSNAGGNGITSWKWTEAGSSDVGTSPIFKRIYKTIGTYNISLSVSNGVCTATNTTALDLKDVRVKAAFEYPAFACPNDTVRFADKSIGPVAGWYWNFGNGNTSNLQAPPMQMYVSTTALTQVPVMLVVSHANGCKDTVVNKIQVPNNCYIAVPTGFTPNGDGLNDYLYPLNAWKAKELHFRVYNRYGQLIWETRDWTRKWDGNMNGSPQTTGTYVWMLEYIDSETGKRISLKGTTVLIR